MPKYGGQNRIDFGVHFNTDKSSLQQVKKSLQDIQNIKPVNFSGTERELDQIKTKAKEVQSAFEKAFSVKLNSLNIDKFYQELDRADISLDEIYKDLSKIGGQGRSAFNQMASSLVTTNTQLRESKGLLQSMGETMMNTVKWGIASRVMNGFTQSVSEAFQYVKSLDSALTDIRIVTGDSTDQMAKFADQANRAAQELGRSTMDYSKAALTFYQQGLSDEDVAARTEATLKAQNITGAGDQMADYLTAVWNGYKVANEEAELYVDKLAAVADSSASNMSQLAIAMSKVASTANLLGVPVDSLNAQIATIVATTRQAPETVGNALKTIYARINDIKTGSDDAEVSLGNYTEQMAKLGVNVLDASGNLRDTGDVIEQIGGKWETLSREQQIYLARTMAGQRQYNNLLALFENWGKYTDLVNVSMEAQGTTMQKNSRYMDSLAAHMEQLGAAGERVKSAMIDSDSFKGLIDIGTELTNLFANLIESIGGGGTALLGLGSIATRVFSGTIAKEISNVIIKSRENKQIYEEMHQAMAQTQNAKTSAAYLDPANSAYKQYIDNLQRVHQSWTVLSQDERQQQQNNIQRIESLSQQKQKLQDSTLAAEKFYSVFSKGKNIGDFSANKIAAELQAKLIPTFGEAKQAYQDFWMSMQDDNASYGIENLYEKVLQLGTVLGGDAEDRAWELALALEKLQQDADYTSRDFDELITEVEKFINQTGQNISSVQNFDQNKNKIKELTQEVKVYSNTVQKVNQDAQVAWNTQNIVKFVGGIGSVVAGMQSLINITKIWGNENLSTGEKILQIISNLTMSFGMFYSGIKQMREGWVSVSNLIIQTGTKIIASRSGETAATIAATTAEGAKSTANITEATTATTAATANATLAASFGAIVLAAAPYIAIIGATVGLIYTLVKAHNASANAAKNAAEAAESAKEHYQELKGSVDELQNSINRYNQIQDSFSSLVQGSEEWNSALQESNQLVLDLLNKFPSLSDAIENVNGKLVLDPEALKQAEQKLTNLTNVAQASNNYLQYQAKQANINNQATNIGRDNAPSGTILGMSSEEIADYTTKVATIFNDFEKGLISGIKPDQLSSYISEQTGVSEKLVEGLLQDEDALRELSTTITENSTALKLATEQIIQNSPQFTESQAYQGATDIDKQVMTNIARQDYDFEWNDAFDRWMYNFTEEMQVWNSKNHEHYQAALEALQQAGYDFKEATSNNAVRGSDDNRSLVFNVDGEDKEYKAKEIASMIAAAEALKGLGNSAENAQEMLLGLSDVGDTNAEGIRQLLAGNDFSGMTEKQVNSLDANTAQMEKYFKRFAERAGYDSAKEFKEAFIQQQKNTADAFKKITDDASEYVKNAFNSLNADDLSLNAQQSIVENLQKAFNEGGMEAANQMTNFYSKISDMDAFTKVTEGLDFSTLTASDFKSALEEAGVATNLTTEELNAYIQAQKGAAAATSEERYKNIHDVIDELKPGDTIDPQQQKKLTDAGVELDNFFSKMPDGTMKLKTSAEEFYNYANNISLQGFKTQIEELENRIQGQQDFEASRWSASNNKDNQEKAFQNFSTSALADSGTIDANKLGAQVAFLQTIPDLGEDINQILKEINAGQGITEEKAEVIAKKVEENRQAWENNKGSINENKNAIEDLEQQMANAVPIDADVDEEALASLTDYIQKLEDLDEDDKGALEISETLKDDRQAAEDLAEAMLRYDHALQQVNDNYEDWAAALSSGNMQQQAEIGKQLKNVYSDMLDLPFESLSSQFTTSTQNLQLLKQAANGSEEAYRQLQVAAQEDIIAHLDLSDSDLQNFQAKLQNVQSMLDEMNFQDLEVGAKLDDTQFLNELTNMVNAANMTAQEATDYLASMGIDAQIVENKAKSEDTKEITGVQPHFTPQTEDFIWYVPDGDGLRQVTRQVSVPMLTYKPGDPIKVQDTKQTTGHTLKVKSARKSSGGAFKFKQAAHGGGNKSNRGSKGGGGGKKGGGSSSKPSIAKTNTTKIDIKKKTQENDPYYKVNKSLEKQSTLLKRLQDQEKNLSGKDRLKNLDAQVENLKEQNELLEQHNRISNNIAAVNSTANLRKRLQDAFGKNISFDSEGKIADLNQTERAAVDSYNKAAQQAQSTFESVQRQYNNWILHTWNANSKAWQEAHQSEKEKWDERIKNAETNAKDAISAAEEEYKKKTDLIKAYEKALQEDQKLYEQYMNNVRKIMQDTFEKRKIKIQFKLDSGELERDWLDFENKVIRKIKDSDIVGNAAAQFRELSSYIQSQELQSVSDEIKTISDDIARVNAGAWTQLMGVSQTDYEMLKPKDQQKIREEALGKLKEQLKTLVKQEQDALSAIQDLTDEIAESYLDSIDAAKDALDEHIDQYERINDLIEHNVKLTELLYGDKGYDTLNKYYDLQKQNNMATLQTLKQQEEYWRSRMQNEVVGSEAWKKFKENLDDAVDAVNSKLEDMLDNLTTQFENKLAAAVERINNKLTGGLGTTYLDEQWDYLNNYDDYFLDTYNATTGIEDVTRAYQQALDDAAANPQQQQRLNKLMNDQLKILREKDKLTQYDLERAKSMLEVEKARMALEDARNNKTKMRLRRDSQGNYTYQYVADEEKLGELQQALADAQNDLYNQDKEHYKENLNTLYDTYKEYIEKMKDLTTEYNATQDEEERKRIQERIDLAKQYYSNMMTGLLEDNEYNQTYITQSFANGLNLDLSGLSSEEAWGVIQENVPWAASNIQNLANSISNLGGLLPATNSLLQEFSSAVTQYQADANDILEAGGTSIQTISQVVDEAGVALDPNIIEANSQTIMGYLDQITEQAQTDVNTMQSLTKELDQYWQTLNNNIQTYINNTREGYNTLQDLLDSSTKAEILDYLVPQINTTSTEGLAQAKEQLSLENISGEDLNTLYDTYKEYLKKQENFAVAMSQHPELYNQLSQQQQEFDEQYKRFYTDLVQDMIQRVSNMSIDSQIDQMTTGTSNLLSNLIKNQSLLDQNVHIDANFPNVNNHTQIEEAFNNLVNMAAMRASGYRD